MALVRAPRAPAAPVDVTKTHQPGFFEAKAAAANHGRDDRAVARTIWALRAVLTRRAEVEQQPTTDSRPDHDGDVSHGRSEPNAGLQCLGADDVVRVELRRGRSQRTGDAVDYEKDGGVPRLERVGEEDDRPRKRDGDQDERTRLDHAAAVVAVGERAEADAG